MRKQVKVYNTSTDYVYSELRGKIISKQFMAGDRLPEVQLATLLKVSRTPVREALLRLSAEGLVTLVPNSGGRVVSPTARDMRKAFAVRELLECSSTAQAASKGLDKKDIAKLEKIIAAGQRAYSKKDVEALNDSNHAFHMALADASGSKVLRDFVEGALLRSSVFVLIIDPKADYSHLLDEHTQLLRAVADRDSTAAAELTKRHLDKVISMLTAE